MFLYIIYSLQIQNIEIDWKAYKKTFLYKDNKNNINTDNMTPAN